MKYNDLKNKKDNLVQISIYTHGDWATIHDYENIRNIRDIEAVNITERISLEKAKELYPDIF